MTDLTAARADLRDAEAAFHAASREAQDAHDEGTLERFYAAWVRRDRARAVVREIEASGMEVAG